MSVNKSEILIDANLLAVWLIGTIAIEYLARFQSETSFNKGDFDLVNTFLMSFHYISVTPYILCEVSHMTFDRSKFPSQIKKDLKELLHKLFSTTESWKEHFPQIKILLTNPSLFLLGLSDISLWSLSEIKKMPLLTMDGLLAETMNANGLSVFKFVPSIGIYDPAGALIS